MVGFVPQHGGRKEIKMKKQLICMASSAAMVFASLTSYAATYDTSNKVSIDIADGKKTVLIYKGDVTDSATRKNIVYIDEAADSFAAQTDFMIKNLASPEGLYTVKLKGETGTVVTDSFYIGMAEGEGDVPMALAGSAAVTGADGKTTYSVGYTANSAGPIGSFIIKVSDENGNTVYKGSNVGINISGESDVKVGIQINGLPGTDYVKGIWISPRVIENGTLQSAPASGN